MFSIADNLESVSSRIQKATKSAGRETDSVTLIAVSKTRSAETLRDAYKLGLRRFGENYLNEALEKQFLLKRLLSLSDYRAIEWHFIGPLQSNKTRETAENFDWVQSVDRAKIAQRLNDQRPEDLPPLNVCLQVNINDEESKSGVPLNQLNELVDIVSAMPRLTLRGLMAIPKLDQDVSALAESFARMQRAFLQLESQIATADTLSLGMSNDIELAIENGSTMIRVGTALFGPRPPK